MIMEKTNDEKIYVGSGVSKFEGNLIACSVCLTDLPQEHMFEYEGKKYIKLVVQQKRETDQYGKTHYVAVDTFKPDPSYKKDEPVADTPAAAEQEDLPF